MTNNPISRLCFCLLISILLLFSFDARAKGGANAVSMVRLLASPEVFQGKEVQVFGYVGGPGGKVLYLTEEHEKYGDSLSAIRLSIDSAIGIFPNAECDQKHVVAQGIIRITENNIIILDNIKYIQDRHLGVLCYKKQGD